MKGSIKTCMEGHIRKVMISSYHDSVTWLSYIDKVIYDPGIIGQGHTGKSLIHTSTKYNDK